MSSFFFEKAGRISFSTLSAVCLFHCTLFFNHRLLPFRGFVQIFRGGQSLLCAVEETVGRKEGNVLPAFLLPFPFLFFTPCIKFSRRMLKFPKHTTLSQMKFAFVFPLLLLTCTVSPKEKGSLFLVLRLEEQFFTQLKTLSFIE